MKKYNIKNGFSILTSLVVIVLMAAVGAFIVSISGKVVQSTSAQYQQEQAILYAKSYTEYAILAVMGSDRSTCLTTIDGRIGANPAIGQGYNVTTNISYIVSDAEQGACTQLNSADLTTTSTPLSIIVDVYVRYKNLEDTAGPWVTVHRRSIQKI